MKNYNNSTIYLVDDDTSIINSIENLLRSEDLSVISFTDPAEFLEYGKTSRTESHCLILDIRMPSMNGLEVQKELLNRLDTIPIIFLTGHGDIPLAVNAIKSGAFDFLTKPFEADALIQIVKKALDYDYEKRASSDKYQRFSEGYKTLTKREKQLLVMILNGMLNKQIAYDLSISEDTVKVHRHNLMKKLNERSWQKIAVMYDSLVSK